MQRGISDEGLRRVAQYKGIEFLVLREAHFASTEVWYDLLDSLDLGEAVEEITEIIIPIDNVEQVEVILEQ